MILYGASGHGKVIADIFLENSIEKIKFWDDAKNVSIRGFNVSSPECDFSEVKDEVLISIGNNKTRKIVADKLGNNVTYGKAIHPSAIISRRSGIDAGSAIMAGVVINIDCSIGKHCIINTSASIDHDCIIEDYVHVSPNATLCGDVRVGEGSHIGAGSVIIQGKKIGKWCTIGAGSVILNDVPDFATVVGNPGRVIKLNYNEI